MQISYVHGPLHILACVGKMQIQISQTCHQLDGFRDNGAEETDDLTAKVCMYLEYDAMSELVGRGQLGLVVADRRRDKAVSEQLLKERQRRAGGIVSSSFHAGCQI